MPKYICIVSTHTEKNVTVMSKNEHDGWKRPSDGGQGLEVLS